VLVGFGIALARACRAHQLENRLDDAFRLVHGSRQRGHTYGDYQLG
jgi:hypothetical protein